MGRGRRKGTITNQNNEDEDEEESENVWVPGTKARPIGNVRTKGEMTMDVSKTLISLIHTNNPVLGLFEIN